MVLVDTSVWVSFLREGNYTLETLLNNGEVMCHPFIVGELACGNIQNRPEILYMLQLLPKAAEATHEEVLLFIESNKVAGKGVGYIDVHLCASALLSDAKIWTLDKSLLKIAVLLDADFSTD
ncbi:MAG: PIN domain-containing protein [Actinobacteria bacterium]|nr:PIN domain-containing protein [Actinomycetota bacterium]